MCRGTRAHPLLAMLFILSIFVEGNKSRGEQEPGGAKDGPGGLADTVLAKGQWMREDSQHLPTAPCAPLSPCLSRYLLLQPF